LEENRQLTTSAVDLFAPGDRFVSASKVYGCLHRWRLLFGRYGWVMALILIVVVGPAYYLTSHAPAAFESKARMWLTGKLDIREGRLYTEELLNYLGTQAELLRSKEIQKRALDKVDDEFPEQKNLRVARHRTVMGTNSVFPFKVEVTEASKSSILELRAVGHEAAATRAFLDHLMAEYLNFKREARQQTSDRTVASVSTQVSELAKELEAQHEKLYAFQSSNNVVFLQEQGNSAGNYLATLNRQLANLRNELRLLQMLQPEQWIEAKTHPKDSGSNEISPDKAASEEMLASLAGPQVDLFKATQQMQLLKAKRDELSKFLRPMHPKIIKLNDDIKTQEHLAQVSRDEAVKQMSHRRQAIQLEITNLESASVEWEGKAVDASRKMADYDRIRQELQRTQAAYDRMLALIQTVDVGRTVEQENVGILEPASVAEPVNHLLRNLAIAVAGSLMLGFGLLYCMAILRDDFSTLTELRNHLSEEVVGQIPAISMRKQKGELGPQTLEKQRFEFLEAFRNLRSWLFFMNNSGTKPRTLVVASSVPAEGKSTIALYLAATMARGNSRVLLVDADMRRGSLHEFFGAPAGPGLAEILERESFLERAMVGTGVENLALLPAGRPKRNPGELVLSAEWDLFLEQAKHQFDYVVVDTPPVLATDDAASLAPKVDGVLFAVRGSFTSARTARAALNILRQRHVRVLGVILNRAVSSRYERQYYQRYHREYGWEANGNGHPAALDANGNGNGVH
jgi:succinoglycan biosynthesis transport protein ExoP